MIWILCDVVYFGWLLTVGLNWVIVAYCWTRLGDSDYSGVLASRPDREGSLFIVGATCAGATTSSAGGLVDCFIALSAG